MRQSIWKYRVPMPGCGSGTHVPANAEFVGMVNGHVYLRFETCQQDYLRDTLELQTVPTGDDLDLPEDMQHAGSWIDGPFVWHTFYKIKKGTPSRG